jgi:hypothetical protein
LSIDLGAIAMEQITGTLMRDGQPVAEGLSGRLAVDYTPTREQRWSGFFTVPPGVTVELKVNDHFDLNLSDGRTGKIKLERVNVTSQGVFVSFGSAE